MAEEEKKTEKEEKLKNKVKETSKVKEESKTSVAEEVSKEVEKSAKEASKPAVEKEKPDKESKKVAKVELEREYIIPLRRGVLKAPRYRRAKKAIRIIREFLVRHMKVRDRDLKKVKIDIDLNNEIWFRGIKKPANKIKVIAKKIDGIVYAELAEVPEVIKFKRAKLEKRAARAAAAAAKKPKKEKEEKDKDKDGIEDKKEEAEDRKSGSLIEAKEQKSLAKAEKHTAAGVHKQKTAPVRKTLK